MNADDTDKAPKAAPFNVIADPCDQRESVADSYEHHLKSPTQNGPGSGSPFLICSRVNLRVGIRSYGTGTTADPGSTTPSESIRIWAREVSGTLIVSSKS